MVVENNALENVLLPHEIDEIKNDNTGSIPKGTLQAIKDNSTYKINADGDFIICVKVAGSSYAPREGERYATQQEILEKGGEIVVTTAVSWGATKVLEPIVVVAKESGVWSKVVGTVKGWLGKDGAEVTIVSKLSDDSVVEKANLDNINFSSKPVLSNDSYSPDVTNQRSAEFYKQYSDNPTRGTLSNVEARQWYFDQ
jgi:filamentous hemagglutinin